ncbi:MAG: hypothetical protein HQK70_01830 [Desulfamplus sp.]|nr:hypothetical protein [Desulfamplus sp.]
MSNEPKNTEIESGKISEILNSASDFFANSISPSELLEPYPYSPADNIEGYKINMPWKSRIVGGFIRNTLQWKNILRTMAQSPHIFGPLSGVAQFHKWLIEHNITDPIYLHAKIATRAGLTPDTYAERDENVENAYGNMIYTLCTLCMSRKDYFCDKSFNSSSGDDAELGSSLKVISTFDREKCRMLSTTPEGIETLKRYMKDFAQLEWQYNSLGLTRLKAMKELLLSLLIVISEKPLNSKSTTEQPASDMETIRSREQLQPDDMPFALKQKPGKPTPLFSEYLNSVRTRLENLYNRNAFNIKLFSEAATNGEIGYCKYKIVEGSQIHTVTLRHYMLPDGIQPNGKILYMVSPLINKAEIFDLAKGKSVVQGMLEAGYTIYLQAPGDPGVEDTDLGLDFYGKVVHDRYIDIIKRRHPDQEIYVMGYCMGGTLFMPYLARRAEELLSRGEEMDIKKIALMAAPVKFDDDASGQGYMRQVIKDDYDEVLMAEMYGEVNVPPQIISVGMNEIQHGVQYNVASGFYSRASFPGAIEDSAPFLYWLTHGTKFGSKAHREWIRNIFIENQIYRQTYCLPSSEPHLDGKPVNMGILKEAKVQIFDYRGKRDPISPVGSCVSSEMWGMVREENCIKKECNLSKTRSGLNRTIEKNIGHIFVVSTQLLSEYLDIVKNFYDGTLKDLDAV